MNEFFLAANRSITLTVNQTAVEVHQVVMHEFDLFLQYATPLKTMIATREYSEELLLELFKNYTQNVLGLLSVLTKNERKELLELAKDQVGFMVLMKAALDINAAFFKQEIKKQSSKVESTWFDSFQFLVSMGHSHSEIMDMSYGTFNAYAEAASKRYALNIFSLTSIHMTEKQQKEYKKNHGLN